MTTGPILLMDDVSRVHGLGETAVRALGEVTLTVHPGELVAVMGAGRLAHLDRPLAR